MEVDRFYAFRLGRIFLVSALGFLIPVQGAFGDALVLHQHSKHRAHLHFLRQADPLWDAAFSSTFGHSSRPGSARDASPGVRVIAVVTTDAVFVSTPQETFVARGNALCPFDGCLFSAAAQQTPPAFDSSSVSFPATGGRTATAVILLRNHTLLV
jgi:hypothetical protein